MCPVATPVAEEGRRWLVKLRDPILFPVAPVGLTRGLGGRRVNEENLGVHRREGD